MELPIRVNGRFIHSQITGVQRYAHAVVSRLSGEYKLIVPNRAMQGSKGHAWEQCVLPFRAKGGLLWSPCNTGPLSVSRQVVTIHDVSPIDHPEWNSRQFAQWYGFMIPHLVRKVRRVITDSNYSRERIIDVSGVDPEQVVTVYLGVDDRFRPQSCERVEATIKKYGLTAGRYVLALSSLEPRKNLPRLLRAWERNLQEIPDDVNLVLAGGIGSANIFADLGVLRVPERVLFTGYFVDEHLPALYTGALGFCYLSLYEGFGLPPLEAMACGTPVLASSATSLAEVVEGGALTVSPTDDDAIAGGLKRLITDSVLQAELREKGAVHVRRFSWDDTARQVSNILIDAARR